MNFRGYDRYSASGVARIGDLPSSWRVVHLKRVAQLVYGDALPADYRTEDGDVPVFGSNGRFAFHNISNTNAPVIFVGRKGSCGAIAWSAVPSFGIDTVYFIDGERSRGDLRWLYWALQTLGLDAMSQDTGVPGLAREAAYSTVVPLPSLSEQIAVANFLDRETAKIDALIAEQERLIALLKEKRQAVISHAVTKGLDPNAPMKDSGIEWLGGVPAHWEVGPLKRWWQVIDCKHVTAEFVPDGLPVASIRESQGRYIDLSGAKQTTPKFFELLTEGERRPQPGDLIFTRNATVGEVAQISDWHPPFAMGQDVCLLRKRRLNYSSDFVWYNLHSLPVERQLAHLMIGSTFKRINVEDVRCLVVAMPPNGEARAISDMLDRQLGAFDEATSAAISGITLLQERRAALISAAVTGKIDVRGLAPASAEAA